MKNIHRYFAILLAVLAISFTAVSAQNMTDAGRTQSIERQVEKKIKKLPRYEVFDHISYSVNGDTVTLYGKVRNAINKGSAASSVKRIPGVSQVINNIEVLPPSGFDDEIRASLYRKISNFGGLSRYLWPVNPSVRLIVDRGRVSLEGYVANKGDYNAMNIVAKTVPGTFEVTNNLKISRDRAN